MTLNEYWDKPKGVQSMRPKWTPPQRPRNEAPQPVPFTINGRPADEPEPRRLQPDGSLSPVAQAHAAIVNADKAYRQHREAVQQSASQYSPQGLVDAVRQFADSDEAKAAQDAVQQVRQRAEQAKQDRDKIRGGLRPADDAASQVAAQRFWDRRSRVLDGLKPERVPAVVANFMKEASPQELSVLMQELPDYLESRGQSSEYLDASLRDRLPEYARATEQLKKAEQARTIIEHGAARLQQAWSEGTPAPGLPIDPSRYDPDGDRDA